ncbi:NAD(P)H-dependent oxidoreductase [Candidatus Parcubacteria bacterium]|nr:NAD(P)H-dependent oxidoreductase [Candidatus Parcubacteria bacterium]
MKNILIITAHPSTHGFTHQIAKAFKEAAVSKGHEVELIDLYKTDLQIPFLKFEEKKDMANLAPATLAIQDKIRWSTDMVFVHPLWWMGMPAIMKNLFDNVLTPGFAYKYIDGKKKALLKDKNAHVFFTCDGNMWWMKTAFFLMGPAKVFWGMGLLYFCGIKHRTLKLFDRKFLRSEEDQQKFLLKVRGVAGRL